MSPLRGSEKPQLLTIDQWVSWLMGSIMGVISVVIFLYGNFLTKESFADYRNEHQRFEAEIMRRLERIEEKLDQMIQE
jgi:hypothetical protein